MSTDEQAAEETERRPAVNWVQVTAGALAAVSSAVLLSTLGVAGTLIGAAVGSVTASLASAFYSRGIETSRQQVASQTGALRRVGSARSRVDSELSAIDRGEGSETSLHRATRELDEAESDLERASSHSGDETPQDGTAQDVPPAEGAHVAPDSDEPQEDAAAADRPETGIAAWRKLPWKRVAVVAVTVFVVAMVAITAFEMATGRAVSTFTGGSDRDTGATVPGLGRGDDRETDQPDDPQDGQTEQDDEPTEEPEDGTESPTSEPAVPTEAPEEPLPTEAPTPAPPAE